MHSTVTSLRLRYIVQTSILMSNNNRMWCIIYSVTCFFFFFKEYSINFAHQEHQRTLGADEDAASSMIFFSFSQFLCQTRQHSAHFYLFFHNGYDNLLAKRIC